MMILIYIYWQAKMIIIKFKSNFNGFLIMFQSEQHSIDILLFSNSRHVKHRSIRIFLIFISSSLTVLSKYIFVFNNKILLSLGFN